MRHSRTILFLLLAFTFVMRAGLSLRSDASLASRLFDDDSFYDQNVSYHLAHGHGLSIDGRMPTNGIQPLVVALRAPCYAIASQDKWLGLRLTLILDALIDTLSVYLVYTLVRRLSANASIAPIAAAALWALTYPILAQTMNGLETGLYSTMLLAVMLLYAMRRANFRSGRHERTTQHILFGIALGLLVLARIDACVFVACFIVFEYFDRKPVSHILIPPVVAVLVSSPWWIYNLTIFGSLMPTSGQAESIGGASLVENLAHAAVALSDVLSTFFTMPYPTTPALVLAVGCIIVPASVFWIARTLGLGRSIRSNNDIQVLYPLLVGGVCILIYYILFFHASYFIPRYIQPLRIAWLLLVAMSAPTFVRTFAQWSLAARSAFVVLLLSGFSVTVVRYAHIMTATGEGDLYRMGLWARKHPAASVGMQQSGIASFVSDNVVNLDGKVNADVLLAMKHGARGRYIDSSGIAYLADWTTFAEVLVQEAEAAGTPFTLVDSVGLVRIYRRTDYADPR
ncbi:MAG: hypothetical protein JSS75_01780 [Bacteroidetes bacterium]|nr:hypothetical protein [Bacteroidota bacterium]